eukprot:1139462-Pelagomonas_calceolata.AAC.5
MVPDRPGQALLLDWELQLTFLNGQRWIWTLNGTQRFGRRQSGIWRETQQPELVMETSKGLRVPKPNPTHQEVGGLIGDIPSIVVHSEGLVGALGLAKPARVLARGGGVQLLCQVCTCGGGKPAGKGGGGGVQLLCQVRTCGGGKHAGVRVCV